jgi:hypothetical protein
MDRLSNILICSLRVSGVLLAKGIANSFPADFGPGHHSRETGVGIKPLGAPASANGRSRKSLNLSGRGSLGVLGFPGMYDIILFDEIDYPELMRNLTDSQNTILPPSYHISLNSLPRSVTDSDM